MDVDEDNEINWRNVYTRAFAGRYDQRSGPAEEFVPELPDGFFWEVKESNWLVYLFSWLTRDYTVRLKNSANIVIAKRRCYGERFISFTMLQVLEDVADEQERVVKGLKEKIANNPSVTWLK